MATNPVPENFGLNRAQAAGRAAQQSTLTSLSPALATAAPSKKQVQMAGSGAVQAGTQASIQSAAQSAEQAASGGRQLLAERQVALKAKAADLQAQAEKRSLRHTALLAQLGGQAATELLDARLKFSEDEAGRKFRNDLQLLDYAAMVARSDEDYQNRAQAVEHASKRKQQAMETALQKLTNQLKTTAEFIESSKSALATIDTKDRLYTSAQSILQTKVDEHRKLNEAVVTLQESVARERARAQERVARNQLIGTLIGAGAGAVATGGNPAGATLGATLGGGVATAIGGSTR